MYYKRKSRHSKYYGFAPYVPVAQRRAQASHETAKLQKQGENIDPVVIEGRTIARSFWGRKWCDHLESFADYENRIPRGRTYVRNGSVCHLSICEGQVEALVSGSSLYKVNIKIKALDSERWDNMKKRCAGQIGSLVELLQGRLSDEVMTVVTDRQNGLFPRPGEISYHCNCPDSADMCKHIAAVFYGIGARLDKSPELLFLLRKVKHDELLGVEAASIITGKGKPGGRRRRLAAGALESVFDVELDHTDETEPEPAREPTKPRRKSDPKATAPKAAAKAARTPRQKKKAKAAAFEATGAQIAELRKTLGVSRSEFARKLGVTAPAVTYWERQSGTIKLRSATFKALQALHQSG